MIIHVGYENLELKKPVVTLGIFDGVHRGHRMLLDSLVSQAHTAGGESVVVTFDPHPRIVLSDNRKGLFFLSTMAEKTKLLQETLVDHLIIIEFNEFIRNMSACEFIRLILVEKIGIKHLIVGYDHHFGRGREGDFTTISECAGKYGFTVQKVNEVTSPGGAISSTSIREALLSGRIEEANNWLGHSYSLSGIVVGGRKIGKAIGFPTANIKPDEYKLVPADGVYAVEVELEDRRLTGMLSIGSNPTVNSDPEIRSVEVHIFNFDADIYGMAVRVIFRYRLRDEIRFGTISGLVRQMELDRKDAMRLLAEQQH
jgi:riboflavin kinase / FMN adenylyltransferase